MIEGLQAEGESERMAKIWWEKGSFDSYRIYYKKSGEGHEWFISDILKDDLDATSTTGELKLYDLEPDTEYETRAQGKKMGTPGNYTEIIQFRTLPIRPAHCGDPAQLPEGGPGNPFGEAIKRTIVNVDGLEMTLLEVTHLGDGYYKGFGSVSIPYLGGATFTTTFDRIFINEDRNVVLGRIDFATKGVASLIPVEDPTPPIADQNDQEKERKKEENREEWEGTDFYGKIFLFDNIIIEDVTANGPYITVTDSEGNKTPNTEVAAILASNPEKAIIIEDKNGDQWVVEKDGDGTKVTKVEGGGLVPGDSSEGSLVATDKEEALLLAVLNDFEEAMTGWLEVHGKGPLTIDEMRLLEGLPEGIPADEDLVRYMVNNSLNAARENKAALIQKIKEENEQFTGLASKTDANGAAYIGLNEAEQATLKLMVAEAFTDWSLSKYFEEALAYFGPYEACVQKGWAKGKETFWKYISLAAAYNAGFVETGLCLTSPEMCGGSDYWAQFSCGAANALIQEIDIIGMSEGVVYLGEAALKNAYECIMDGGIVGMSITAENGDGVLYAALKCGIGIDVKPEELKGIYNSVEKYAVENWADPHLHGQATVAVITIVVPLTKLSKVKLLNKLKTSKLASKFDELQDISKAADEGGLAKAKEVLDGKIGKGGGKLLSAEGKFIDNILEADYQKYVKRKTKSGKTPRERVDWKETRDYWLNDSPMARGNAFNDKAKLESWYPYDEVHLGNGKRLDSYKPPKNGEPGEIVSRKATNIDDIELSTFEAYLREMQTKYSAGTPINSPKYSPVLDNQVLQGRQILEIPASNQNISDIQQYIDLAKKYSIEIKFRPE